MIREKNKINRRSGALLILIYALLLLMPRFSYALDAQREVMDNGLVVLHSERDNLPIVQVTLLIKGSPLDEPADKGGLANLTARMLVEGTTARTSEQISGEIEFVGGSIGASADYDYTLVTLSVLKKDIDKGFALFSDIVLNPSFPNNELANKKRLIRGEIRQSGEDPQYVAGRAFSEAVYGNHPYGRPVTGTIESIGNISRKDLVDFHRAYYLPDNSILSVSGDLGISELRQLIGKYLSKWKRGVVPARKQYTANSILSPKVIMIDKKIEQANIILGHIGIKRSNPDYYAVSVMNYILGGGGFSSRLMETIRDKMGLAYDVHSYFTVSKQRGVFEVGVQTRNKTANRVVAEILKQIKRMQNENVTGTELTDAISYLTGSFPRRLDTMAKFSRLLALVEFYGLGLDYDSSYMENVKKVTIADVRRAAKKYLHPDKYVLVIVADRKKVR
ncbi:peptidase M16 inactive domain protein [bacterium BMS3Abin07]|nr:peptidase M16 inactive domain protein [bacterium BMS3Abin07]GBE32776.1 peptidase M16 inactive domain protein [bacterium BMS3Bbin05]HDO21571.1 insulinase family protein [Nitrospirota bacterium]HDZ87243.1 insulinase family protein [Nitrospirota bacterium]